MARAPRVIRPMTKERFEELCVWAYSILPKGPERKMTIELADEIKRLRDLMDLHRSMYRDSVRRCRAEYIPKGPYYGTDPIPVPERCQRPAGHGNVHAVIRDDDSALMWSIGTFSINNL